MRETSVGQFLNLVTLFFNSSVINNLDNYEPLDRSASYYFYQNLSDENAAPRPVEQDVGYFEHSTFFPRCCQPGTVYDTDSRGCVPSENIVPIHEELHITVNLIESGLKYCTVVVDRFVKKYDFKVEEGNATLRVENENFEERRFCVDNILQNDEDYVVRLCREDDYCENVTKNIENEWCVHKCCEEGYQLVNYRCVLNDRMGIHVKNNTKFYERTDGYAMMYGPGIDCKATFWKHFEQIEFSIKANGSMFWASREYYLNHYCLATNYDTSTGLVADMIVICEFNEAIYLKWLLIKIAVVITCACFVITLGVYVFVYKLQKLFQRIIAAFCLVDLVFWCMYMFRLFNFRFGNFCVGFAYIYYFVSMSRLSWLNVLSYEIFTNIGVLRVITAKPLPQALRKEMFHCTMYAVLVPMVLMTFFILGNQEVYDLGRFTPLVNKASCFMDTRGLDGNMGYLHLVIPVSVLIVINIALFIRTVMYFLRTKRQLEEMTDSSVMHEQIKKNNKKGVIVLKLALVMGLSWIYHIYAYISSIEKSEILANIGDIMSFINIFEGVYIFLIFAVKWKKIKDRLEQLGILRPKMSRASSTETVTSIISSDSKNEISMVKFGKPN